MRDCLGLSGADGVTEHLVHYSNDILDTNLGFDQIAISTKGLAALALFLRAEGSHHNDFYTLGFGGRAQDIEHVKTTDLWHHNVAYDQGRPLFDGHRQRFFAVAGRYDVIAFGEQTDTINFAQAFVVLDEHYFSHTCLSLYEEWWKNAIAFMLWALRWVERRDVTVRRVHWRVGVQLLVAPLVQS